MNNAYELFNSLRTQIRIDESGDEIDSMLFLVFEKMFDISRTSILAGKTLENVDHIALHRIVERINSDEPIQYILEEAEFFGRKFFVAPGVLIPRPETEDIVRIVRQNYSDASFSGVIFDIGTGSGCIGVTLAEMFRRSQVIATDVSERALEIALVNGKDSGNFTVIEHNILTEPLTTMADIIVSNPPYIADDEKNTMNNNVLAFEPHLALFAPKADALIFYRALAALAVDRLKSGGLIAVEINERYGPEVAALFRNANLGRTEIHKDINGKDRIVTARR